MVLRSRAQRRVYELGRRIAAGGMGEVYEGYAADLGQAVAIKRVLESIATEDDLAPLFLREVAVAATLEHPNVVEVLDAGTTGTDLFLVMELVDGPSLAEILYVLREWQQRLPIELTCGIVGHVARGLAHAHERALPDGTGLGIVHRDVAPENVLVTSAGLPKVVDFGLAKLSGHSLTNPGVIRGRPRNLSPEQARGEAVDARADVFSLGAMLFEMVSGEPLYTGDGVASLLWRVAEGDYDPVAPRLAGVDEDLVAIIERSVAVRARERYRSAREIERMLDGFRAARGMRVDSQAVAAVVAQTWPRIEAIRRERLAGTRGELEGATLVLDADRQEPPGPGPMSGPDSPQSRSPGSMNSKPAIRGEGRSHPASEPDRRPHPGATRPVNEPKQREPERERGQQPRRGVAEWGHRGPSDRGPSLESPMAHGISTSEGLWSLASDLLIADPRSSTASHGQMSSSLARGSAMSLPIAPAQPFPLSEPLPLSERSSMSERPHRSPLSEPSPLSETLPPSDPDHPLPRPVAPAKRPKSQREERSAHLWLAYCGAVLVVAAVVFGMIWWVASPSLEGHGTQVRVVATGNP